jgi:outer membrane protein OmpA-like peptidoglycan-associated protein
MDRGRLMRADEKLVGRLFIFDGKDALRWTLSVSRKGQAKPLRVLSGKSLPPTLAWDGRDKGGKAVADGAYTLGLAVLLRGGSTVTAQADIEVDTRRPALELDAAPKVFAPGGSTGSVTFKLGLSGEAGIPAAWTLRMESLDGKALKTFAGAGVPPATVVWNGVDEKGAGVAEASLYYADLRVEMESGALARLPRVALASRLEEPKQPFRVPLQTLRFDAGEEVIALEDYRGLKEAAAAVKKYSNDYVVVVAGHASQAESARNGLGEIELSFLRAKAVRDYLVDSEGLDPKRVRTAGYGSQQPVPGDGGRERDRRVEVILYAQ